jgi:ATP-dependent Zn protease
MAAAVELKDPKYDPIFAPVDRDHYVESHEVYEFTDDLVDVTIPEMVKASKDQTEVTNDAIQSLLDSLNELETGETITDEDFNEFMDSFDNDLRIWWGESE